MIIKLAKIDNQILQSMAITAVPVTVMAALMHRNLTKKYQWKKPKNDSKTS